MNSYIQFASLAALTVILSGCEMATGISKLPFQLAGGLVPKALVCQPSQQDFTYIKTCQSLVESDSDYENLIKNSVQQGGKNFTLESCSKQRKADIGTYGDTDPIYSCGIGVFSDEAYYFKVDKKYRADWIAFNQKLSLRVEQFSKKSPDISKIFYVRQAKELEKDYKSLSYKLYDYSSFLKKSKINADGEKIDFQVLDSAIQKISGYSNFNAEQIANIIIKNKKISKSNKLLYAHTKINLLQDLGLNMSGYVDIAPVGTPAVKTEVISNVKVSSVAVTGISKSLNPDYVYAKAELESAEKNFLGDAARIVGSAMTQLKSENYLGYAQTMLSDDNAGRRLDDLRDQLRTTPQYIYRNSTQPYSYSNKTIRLTKSFNFRIVINLREDNIRLVTTRQVVDKKDVVIKEGFSCKDSSLLIDGQLGFCPKYDIKATINAFASEKISDESWSSLVANSLGGNDFKLASR